MNKFEFSPADGLMDKTSFPTNLGSETEARQQFMTLFNQIKDFTNNEVNEINNIEKTVNGERNYTTNGYKTIGDFIINWGTVTDVANNSNVSVSYAKSFKNKCFVSFANGNYKNSQGYVLHTNSFGLTGGTIYKYHAAGGSSKDDVFWVAIGY